MGRASCALAVRSPRVAHARVSTVTRSTVMRCGLDSGKVLPTSTVGVPGWRRAGRGEAGLTLAVARCEGAKRRCRRIGGGRRRGREGSGEQQGGHVARGGGKGGGCCATSEWRGKNAAWGRKFGRRWRLRFKGERRGGGPEGWAPRGGGAGEREGERGAWARRGAARRCGVDASAARLRCAWAPRYRATVEGGGVGATWDGVAAGGPGHNEGLVVSSWVRREAAR
jgi:hypothetical protein